MSFVRHPKNPILLPNKYQAWEDMAVFNPGAVFFQGKFHLLYRAIGEYKQYVSTVGHAVADDGVNFVRNPSPVIVPEKEYEKYGIEDLRINPMEGVFYLTYTVLGSPANEGGEPHQVGLIKTDNFEQFERLGVITQKEICSRNGVLFPEKINNYYVLLHRPIYSAGEGGQEKQSPVAPKIWISYSKNLLDWGNHQLLMEPLYWWESYKIGGGPPPIKTKKGWLLVYHGVDENRVYRVGMIVLDLIDPSKVLFRASKPLLEPETDYEINGDVPNVVFPTGLILKNDTLFLYYGAADKTCCLATASLAGILQEVV